MLALYCLAMPYLCAAAPVHCFRQSMQPRPSFPPRTLTKGQTAMHVKKADMSNVNHRLNHKQTQKACCHRT